MTDRLQEILAGDSVHEILARLRVDLSPFADEVRDLRAANPPNLANFFAKSGLPEFLDDGDTAGINMLALAWLQGAEKAGAKPSAALCEFVQAESDRNDFLRDAKKERAALAGAADATLNPAELRKRAVEWEKIYEAHDVRDPECAAAAAGVMCALNDRARQITMTRSVLMGGDDRTRMTGAELECLRDYRGEIIAAADNPPQGYCKQCEEWRTRPDLLALMLAVYLRGLPVNADGKTFASDSAGAFQIRVYCSGAFAFRKNAQGKWERGPDIFAVAGKLIGREADFPAQAAAVNALIKYARIVSPNALADLREWEDSPAPAVAAQISADKKCYRKISEIPASVAWGETATLRALTPDDVGKGGAGIMGIFDLANPTKGGGNCLARMSGKEIKAAAAAAAAGRKEAGYHSFKFLHDAGLLDQLRDVRNFSEWTQCLRVLAQSDRWVRLRAALRVWYDALQPGYKRFADCIQRDRHSICAQAKAARCGRDTMRKIRRTLEKGGKLSRVRGGDDLRCAFYRLTVRPRLAANAVFHALGRARKQAGNVAAAFAPRHIFPLATAPPSR